MKATSLIRQLNAIIAEEGDLDVGFYDTEARLYFVVDKVESRDSARLYPHDEQINRFIALLE